MRKTYFLIVGVSIALSACKSSSPVATIQQPTEEILIPHKKIYSTSEKRHVDLLHTRLEVSFDWEKQRLNGKANLKFKPYFYNISTIELDAKGFDLHKIAIKNGETLVDLEYEYDSLILSLTLNREYTNTDTFHLYIEYTAKPNELPKGGSSTITGDKGLYFVNPLGKEENKPRQLWTQGETEASSCWFPTIDAPNERATQEILMTVEKDFKTLSNGLLIDQIDNGDGTRTDHWLMDQPHAPYLAMMAVGDFYIEKEKWNDIEVSYYVDPEYATDAKAIFGNTPEMIEFYSKRLGVDYPWKKYSQAIVHDFVSGAMENTTATIHGSFVQNTRRELIDADQDDIISHELFHHWFGDYVTCESWANLPLNESFATYGEYLWQEHKHGREAADHHLQGNLTTYLMEARRKQEDMIRFDYIDKDDMFDSHSYAKGGRILHMLRTVVGDEAFFSSLQLYLTRNAYRSVEIHDLRLAFEEITGEDLNWFFNQWFLSSGHPEITIDYSYDESSMEQKIVIRQTQDFTQTPLYQLPLAIDIYKNGAATRHNVVINEAEEEFKFKVSGKPQLVNVDAQKYLLWKKKDKKERAAWPVQYKLAPLYLDRYEAIKKCGLYARKDSAASQAIIAALDDRYHNIRSLAIRSLKYPVQNHPDVVKIKLKQLAASDPKSSVRAAAIGKLVRYYDDDKSLLALFKNAVKDSSYSVIGAALEAIVKLDAQEGMAIAKSLEGEKSSRILSRIANIYADKGGDTESAFFERAAKEITGYKRITFISTYERFLKRSSNQTTLNAGISYLENIARNEPTYFIQLYGVQALKSLLENTRQREHNLNKDMLAAKGAGESGKGVDKLRNELERTRTIKQRIKAILKDVNADGDDNRHVRYEVRDDK